MKKMVTDTMLMPAYVSRFACIGGDCEDTCCAGCCIQLDRASFLTYKASIDPVLQPLFEKHVHRNPESTSAEDFGTIDLKDDDWHGCTFLNDQKLCRIYEGMGEQALSDTCAYYPRTVLQCGTSHQVALTLSCPEAARLALLERDAFELMTLPQTVSQAYVGSLEPRFGFPLDVMDDVRLLLFQVLASEDISLGNRLRVIGLFCDRLTGLILSRQTADLPLVVESLVRDLDDAAGSSPLAGQGAFPEAVARAAAPYLTVGREAFQTPHVRKVLEEVGRGLGLQDERAPVGAELVHAYKVGLERLTPALERVPWLLENYLRNEFLKEFFPWVLGNPKRHYATVILRYALIRLLLAGRAAAREVPLTPGELAETIQVGCRRYVNDKGFTLYLAEHLARSDWDSLESLHTLL
ncbi:MAG: flagellin lysine-N-methylase [Geothrix sp.]|uniref:flagellin lysine-N-methylase n=1 Tax=Geothrix sp. TaxID=1962974 RepID=UPI003BB14609